MDPIAMAPVDRGKNKDDVAPSGNVPRSLSRNSSNAFESESARAGACRHHANSIDLRSRLRPISRDYNIDHDNGLTELEAGSYVFMDTIYSGIGSKSGDSVYSDFLGSLTVLTTVDAKLHPG